MNSNIEKDIPEISKVVERNVNRLLHRKQEDLKKRSIKERIIDSITSFAGSILSIFIHFVFFGGWVVWNLGLLGLKPFDPDFLYLGTFAAVEAIFLATFVLIGQRQMNMQAEKWEELNLQMSLLTEQEVTRVLTMVSAIAKKMDIEVAEDKEIQELSKDIHPDHVLDTIEKASQ